MSPGVHESRSPGVQESRSPGVQESRSPGVQESRSPGVQESRLTRDPLSTERNQLCSAENYSSSNDDPGGATPVPVEHESGLEQHGTGC